MQQTIPPFDRFIRQPNNPDCPSIQPRDICIEIAWFVSSTMDEHSLWENTISGPFECDKQAFIFRLRNKRKEWIPVAVLSFTLENTRVILTSLQGMKKGYRFHSSFDLYTYASYLIVDFFAGLEIQATLHPGCIEGSSYGSQAYTQWRTLIQKVSFLSTRGVSQPTPPSPSVSP